VSTIKKDCEIREGGKKKKIEEEKILSKFCKKGVAPNFFLIHRGAALSKYKSKTTTLKLSDAPIALRMLQTEQLRLI